MAIRGRICGGIFVVVLALTLVSCKSAIGGDLRRSLPAAAIEGYLYSRVVTDEASVESLTNPAVVDSVTQPQGTTSVVVGYKRVVDRKSNTARTYKTEARRAGEQGTLVVTDLASRQVVLEQAFVPGPNPGSSRFETIGDCIDDFLAKQGAALQKEANRTCREQFWGLNCCLNNGACAGVDGSVRPNLLRCSVVGPITPFEAAVFTLF